MFCDKHGLLASKIGNGIAKKYRPIYWFKTLIIINEHYERQLNSNEIDHLPHLDISLNYTA